MHRHWTHCFTWATNVVNKNVSGYTRSLKRVTKLLDVAVWLLEPIKEVPDTS